MTTTRSSGRRIALSGDVTIATAAQVRAELLGALEQGGDLRVDLAKVTEIDTAGLQVLLHGRRLAPHLGGAVRFQRCPAALRDTLAVAGLGGDLAPLPVKSGGGRR